MKQFYNRRERRNLAKQLGLINTNESTKQRSERVFRSIQAGRQIEQQFQMIVENDQREFLTETYASCTRNLANGLVLRWSKPELLEPAEVDATGKVTKPALYSDPEALLTSPGHGDAEAQKIMESNYKVAEKRRLELQNRRAKQYKKEEEKRQAEAELARIRQERKAAKKAKQTA